MIPLVMLISILVVTPIGIPSSVREECEDHAKLIEQVKYLQIQGKTVTEVAILLDLAGYDELIQGTFDLLLTPEKLRERAYAKCLKMFED